MKRPKVEFSVNPDQKIEIDNYAKIKGFDKASNLARVATFYYMRKNPLVRRKPARSGTAHAVDEIL